MTVTSSLSTPQALGRPRVGVFRRPALAAALLGALPAFLVYLRTVSPTITGWDAGDLTTAGWTLGIAHPPGYPLYTLLGRLFALVVPIGDVGFRFALFSAVAATAAVGITAAAATLISGDVIAGAVAGWILAFATTFWSQAVVTEVYALNTLFFALVFFLLFRWGERGEARSLFLAAFVFGLGLAHHLTLGVSAPAIALYVLARRRSAPFRWVWVPLLAALLFLGPVLYFYLLIRARQGPAYNFANPATWERFLFHVQAKAYYFRLVKVTSHIWVRRFLSTGAAIVQEIGWPGVGAALAGIVLLARRNRAIAAVVPVVILAYAAYTAAYRIPDIRSYYLPVIAILVLPIAVLLATLRAALVHRSRRALAAGLAMVAAGLPATLLVRNWTENDLHNSRVTRLYVEGVLDTCTRRGTRPARLLILGDTDLFVAAYLKLVEHRHPELAVYDLAGNVFEDIYNWRGGKGAPSRHLLREEERWAAEAKLVRTSRVPVFYDPHPSYELPGVQIVQQGLVFQAAPREAPRPAAPDIWGFAPALARITPSPRLDPESRHMLANYYLLRGADEMVHLDNRPRAERDWAAAQTLAGDAADVRQNLSRFFLAAGESTRALAECRRVIELAPDDGASYANLADVLIRMGDSTEAARQYERGLAVSGFLDADQYIHLGNIYRARGDNESAAMIYRYALAAQPHDAVGWATLASVYLRMRRLREAEYCNKKAIENDPRLAAAHGNLGLIYYNTNHYPEAERELLAAQSLTPGDPHVGANLALLYADMGRPRDAAAAWRRVLRIAPDYPDAHFELGVLAENAGDLARAREEIEEELRLHPTHTRAIGELGLLARRAGDMQRAAALWERVLVFDPADSRAHFNLARLYEERHDVPRAVAHYRAFLRIVPSGDVADQARAALVRLGAAA